MKTLSHSLLFLALAASGHAFAQDPHAGHHGHDPAAKPVADADPHAAHRDHTTPAEDQRARGQHSAGAADPHAGHAMPKAKPVTQNADPHAAHHHHGMAPSDHGAHRRHGAGNADPHAGHTMPAAKNDPHAGHDMSSMDHSMHSADPHAGHVMSAAKNDPHAGHDMSSMDHSMHSTDPHAGHAMPAKAASDTPREPIPALTPDDFAAAFPVPKPRAMEHAPAFNSLVVFDRLEAWDNAHGDGQRWSIDAWFGNDIDRLWLRSDGERADSHLGSWSVDALYGRAISPWWDVVAGVRHDGGDTPGLTRAAIGLQGLAPYKFDIAATAYIGGPRKAELALEAEYDVLLTNRLILQPLIEASIAADDDPRRGVGNGLGHVEAGLRLRYEITRRFAPYVGFVHERKFGRTADLHRDAGEGVRDSRWVAGMRFWF